MADGKGDVEGVGTMEGGAEVDADTDAAELTNVALEPERDRNALVVPAETSDACLTGLVLVLLLFRFDCFRDEFRRVSSLTERPAEAEAEVDVEEKVFLKLARSFDEDRLENTDEATSGRTWPKGTHNPRPFLFPLLGAVSIGPASNHYYHKNIKLPDFELASRTMGSTLIMLFQADATGTVALFGTASSTAPSTTVSRGNAVATDSSVILIRCIGADLFTARRYPPLQDKRNAKNNSPPWSHELDEFGWSVILGLVIEYSISHYMIEGHKMARALYYNRKSVNAPSRLE